MSGRQGRVSLTDLHSGITQPTVLASEGRLSYASMSAIHDRVGLRLGKHVEIVRSSIDAENTPSVP